MIFYHGSSIRDLKELKPFVSEHKKPYIYFATNPVVASIYTVRPFEKPFNWYPYGFDKDGNVVYSEYHPNAFAQIYKGKVGYLYECDNIQNAENPTNINSAYTWNTPVKVDRMNEINDVYEKFMEYQEQGLFRVKPFEEVSEKELNIAHDYLRDLIKENDLLSKRDSNMSKFIYENFNCVWEGLKNVVTTGKRK